MPKIKIKTMKRSVIAVVLCCAFLFFATVATFLPRTIHAFSVGKRLTPIYSVDRKDNKIAISFDAAWGADKTLAILNVLKENNVKATFFLVAFWAEKYPDIVKEIVNSGHEIGTHSSTHPHFNSLSSEKMRDELAGSIERIEKISNTKIKVFRPPFGEYNNEMLGICAELGIYAIQWDVDSLDWKGISANDINERIISRTKSGSIILCHNNADNIVEAIKTTIPKLLDKGYTFAKMSDLIFAENYYIDSNGVQKTTV